MLAGPQRRCGTPQRQTWVVPAEAALAVVTALVVAPPTAYLAARMASLVELGLAAAGFSAAFLRIGASRLVCPLRSRGVEDKAVGLPAVWVAAECSWRSRTWRSQRRCGLYYIKDGLHWEPAENALWFTKNVLCDKKMSYKKFRLLYEWVEDEIDGKSFILASDVRYQAGVLVGAGFDKSAKFKDLGKRMKKFLKLTVTGTNRTTKWIPKV